jgi:hypothetical protein
MGGPFNDVQLTCCTDTDHSICSKNATAALAVPVRS